jgi:hypothetical protein
VSPPGTFSNSNTVTWRSAEKVGISSNSPCPQRAVGAQPAVVVEVGEDSRQAVAEHLAADPAKQLGHEDAANPGEPRVLVGKAGAVADWRKAVRDLGGVASAVVGPGVAEQGS